MSISNEKIYKYHVCNIRSIEIALTQTALSARKSIAEKNKNAVKSFVSLYAFLIGTWAENRLKKLLYEVSIFSEIERKTILSQSTQLDQWKRLVEVAFRKHYHVPKARLNSSNLPFSASAQYDMLIEIFDNDLRSIIEIRNKLAHGQWIYPFNNNGDNIESEKYRLLMKENLPSLQYKKTLLISLADIIHDLVVSLPTFERDFNKNYKKIINARNNLKNRSYAKYEESLIKKRERGILNRKKTSSIVGLEIEK